MKSVKVAVMDSGVGGLSVLKALTEEIPYCEYFYFGDNANAPYGMKNERELTSLTIKNLFFILSFGVDIIVVGCNTVSVSVLEKVRAFSPVKIFGIYPPVERETTSGNKVLLLATDVTARKFQGRKNVTALGLTRLVEAIESNLGCVSDVKIKNLLPAGYEKFYTLIMGCTHFEFVKKQIINHFCPHKITSGVEDVVRNVKSYINKINSIDYIYRKSINFIGNNARINYEFWRKIQAKK